MKNKIKTTFVFFGHVLKSCNLTIDTNFNQYMVIIQKTHKYTHTYT